MSRGSGRKKQHLGTPADPEVDPVVGGEDTGKDEKGLRMVAAQTGDATASDGGIANTGVWIDQVVQQEAPRQPAAWPHMVGSPPGRALGFQKRAEASRLRAVLENEGTAVVGQVLSGLGGVGKTQLAADYALTAFSSGRLDVLVWVTAASRQAVLDGYTRAAVELLGTWPDEHAAQRFLAWLQPSASRPACRWLVVLDDLSDPADLAGLWPPTHPHGRTLATTRRRDAALTGPGRRRVELGVFTPAAAAAALREALAERDHSAQPPEQVRALAEELGFLPLALSQAAAYIADAGLKVADYRTRLADRARTLADLLPHPGQPGEAYGGDALPDGQSATLAAAWSLSIERADRLHPQGLSRPMLQLASVLDPNGIPQTVLTSAPALEHLSSHRTAPPVAASPTGSSPSGTAAPTPGPVDAEQAVAALRALYRLSLIEHNPDQPNTAVRVHQLVQRTTRETLTPADQKQLARTAADALMDAWPDTENDTALAQALRANTTALERIANCALYSPDVHSVLFRTGFSLGDSGQAAAARDHFHHLHNRTDQLLGPDHPDTLAARGNLAGWRAEAGDVAGAATALAELLPELVRVLGPEHPHTLIMSSNLADWRGQAGDVAGAATALAELLPELVRVLGPDHHETLTARGNLVRWRGQAGDTAGAAAALAELLPGLVRVLGLEDHALVISSNLVNSLVGDANGAAAAFAELFADRLRVLGPDSPDILVACGNLADWRGQAGDVAGAATALAELLPELVRVLGPEHSNTVRARDALARWQAEASFGASSSEGPPHT